MRALCLVPRGIEVVRLIYCKNTDFQEFLTLDAHGIDQF